MNKTRRKALQGILDKLEGLQEDLQTIQEQEEEYRDNMPEAFQETERYEKADVACDALSDAITALEEAAENIGTATTTA